MTDALTPNPTTFDIADLFTGKAYPKTEVEVFLDEDAAYEITKNSRATTRAVVAEDTAALKDLEAKHHELVKRAAASKVTFHLTGVSRAERKAMMEKTLEDYPLEYNLLGRPNPNPKADEVHADRKWALHTERIVRADGSQIVAPTPDQIHVFRDNAPDAVVEQIEQAIMDLSDGVKGGFETLVQETGFLSQP